MRLTTTGEFDVEEGLDQHLDVLRELGECHTALGNYDRARECFARASDLAPERAAPYVGLGVMGIQSGRLVEAESAFRRAIALDPDAAEAYGGLAVIFQRREDYQAALDMYLRCLERDTDNLVALLGLFQTSCQMGSFGQVIRYLRLYLDRHPGDTSVLYCLATLYARDGRLGEAHEALLTILALEPANADAAKLLKEIERSGRTAAPPARSAR
jgi:tetratricopeptide (TPR) repeat protein